VRGVALEDRLQSLPLLNRAQPFPRAAYAVAVERYITRVTSFNTVAAAYQIGSIAVPGLSDIDLILVMRDASPDLAARYDIVTLDPADRYLFSHGPLLIDRAGFQTLPLWFPADDARWVWGERLPLDMRPDDGGGVAAVHVVQMLLCYQLQFLRAFAFGDAINERVTENVLRGLCNTVSRWHRVEPWPDGAAFEQQYLAFRCVWFDLDRETRDARFRKFIGAAATLTANLIERVASHLGSEWFHDDGAADVEVQLGGTRVAFARDWTPDLVAEALNGGTLRFPAMFGTFVRAYAQSTGIIGRHVARTFAEHRLPAVRFRSARAEALVSRHRAAVETMAAFHATKFRSAANPFVTFWAPHASSALVRLRDRVYNRARRELLTWSAG
jgi:hypothetical protein